MVASETVGEAIRVTAMRLAATSDTARLDAEVLMAHALGVNRSDLLLRHMRDHAPTGFAALIERRAAHEPVAYIVGVQEFFGLPFAVDPRVLIPRADSEVLVETALAERPDARRVLDCGTGSGALLLAVLAHLPHATGTGIDASAGALAVATCNAQALGLAERARMALANWREEGWAGSLGGPFDLILANPPYVEDDAALDASVRDFEPGSALFSGPDGLDDYRLLIPQVPGLLAPGGLALFEIGATQEMAVTILGAAAKLTARTVKDLASRPRVVAFSC